VKITLSFNPVLVRRLCHQPSLIVLLSALLTGCAGLPVQPWQQLGTQPADPLERDGRPLVITGFTVIRSMADAVACGRLQVESLLAPGQEIHAHQPGERERIWLGQADLVLLHGMGLQPWLPPLLAPLPALPTADVTAGIQPLTIPTGPLAGQPDPHAWMSPRQALVYVRNIRDAFIAFDPANASTYQSCAERYSADLKRVDQQLRQQLSTIPGAQRVLVSCEGSLAYIGADYNLEQTYLWPSQGEPKVDSARLAAIAAKVRERRLPAVFCESTFDHSQQRQVAEKAGARFGGTLYTDSLSGLDGLAPSYIELLRHNADLIKRGLQ
jgi:manganese transport system substrate-binding protein